MQHVPHAAAGSRPKAPALDEGSEQAASGGGLGLSGGDGGGGAGMADWSFADDSLPLGLAPSVSLAVVVCCGVVWCGVEWSCERPSLSRVARPCSRRLLHQHARLCIHLCF